MGLWGRKRDDGIKIWMRRWSFMAMKGRLRRFWNNRIKTIMKQGMSLASLRPLGRSYAFTLSMKWSGGGLAQPLECSSKHSVSPPCTESHFMPRLLRTSQEKVLFAMQYSLTKHSSLKLKTPVRYFCLKLKNKGIKPLIYFSERKLKEKSYTQQRLVEINNWALPRFIPFRQERTPKPLKNWVTAWEEKGEQDQTAKGMEIL